MADDDVVMDEGEQNMEDEENTQNEMRISNALATMKSIKQHPFIVDNFKQILRAISDIIYEDFNNDEYTPKQI